MTKWLAAFATVATVMVAIDLLWIGWLARPLYVQGIGHLMAPAPKIGVALLFYLVYAGGIVVFAVAPQAGTAGVGRVAAMAALFGFVAYATYDLTNLATLRDWPWRLALIDMAWGSGISAVSASAGKLVLDRIGAA
jgi:uncharacterized membrane protein